MQIATSSAILLDSTKIIKKIGCFWNDISEAWHLVWGEHIHHGYYDHGYYDRDDQDLTPQERLIEEIIKLAGISECKDLTIADVGCGMGGSVIYLAKKLNAKMIGLTLSTKQKGIAEQKTRDAQLNGVEIRIDDAHFLNSIADNSCDLVWSLESCEQFYDKELFIKAAFRVLKPGGKIIIATWCAEKEILEDQAAIEYKKLCYHFDLPYMPTIQYYTSTLNKYFTVIESKDWSNYVKQSWDLGIQKLKQYSFFQLFRLTGFRGLTFIRYLKVMSNAFLAGRIRYGVFVATKISI